MAAHDVMRRYLEAVQRGDWETGFGFFADDIVLHVPGRSSLAGEHSGRPAAEGHLPGGAVEIHRANVYRLRGDRIAEVWIFEANQYEVDELFADPPPGG